MDSAAVSRLTHRGGTDHGFSARQLREETLAGANFVLAMAEEHRGAIVAMSPKMLKRTYTISEFAAVLDDLTHRDAPRDAARLRQQRHAGGELAPGEV